MKNALLALSLGTLVGLAFGDEPKIERKPLNIGAAAEFGPVMKGLYNTALAPTNAEEFQGQWVDHFLAYINQSTIIQERLHLQAGLGGIFQFRKPEIQGLGFPSHQRKAFFIGPSTTQAVYHVGDVEQPWLKLGLGMFSYKYNPEAVNLGEYLFRAGAYPTFLRTGGYLVVNNASAQLQGFKANFHFGNFKADVFLATETSLAPLFDWSAAAVTEYSLGGGLFTVGAGVNFQHLLSVRPSRTAVATDFNSYFTYKNVEYTGNTEYYNSQAGFEKTLADSLEKRNPEANAPRVAALRASAANLESTSQLVSGLLANPASRDSLDIKHYTSAGILLMGRATLDIKKAFGGELFGPEDLKLYGEVNLLGVENYPVFYKKRTERMPMMVGFNFPGFKVLDLIALQAEVFNSPWMNNTFMRSTRRGGNIPFFPAASDTVISQNAYNDAAAKGHFKWSVLVKKNLGKHVSFSTQVASDHLTLTSSTYYYGPQFDPNEFTAFKDHWYWISQLSFGI